MDVKFAVNEYVLIWNLLYQASITKPIYDLKKKLWNNYKDEFNSTYKDKNLILTDQKNFIPADDTIYDIMFESKDYKVLEKRAEKFRLEIMKLWDSNKKIINLFIKRHIRKELRPYTIYIVNNELDVEEIFTTDTEGVIVFGKKIDQEKPINTIINIILTIIKQETNIEENSVDGNILRDSIIELAVINELQTNIYKKSYYKYGTEKLLRVKEKLYPYWLMYLGVPRKNFRDYMERDNIEFDESLYAYEKQLIKMNLEEFIGFCIRNKKYIFSAERKQV